MIYKHTVVYRHAYHLNVPSFVSSQWSKIWFQRPIWDRCLHDGPVSFLRGRSIQGILGFFWLYCTHQCGQMKHFGQDARNRQSELMISSNKLLLQNMMPCHHLSIARLKTTGGKYSWLNLPRFATSVKVGGSLVELASTKKCGVASLECQETCGILCFTAGNSWIKWDHKSLQASNHQQLQDDSPVKEQWQEITRNLDYIWWPVWQKSRTCTLRSILVWNFQYIHPWTQLSHCRVEVGRPSSDMLRVLRKRECISLHIFFTKHIQMVYTYFTTTVFSCIPDTQFRWAFRVQNFKGASLTLVISPLKENGFKSRSPQVQSPGWFLMHQSGSKFGSNFLQRLESRCNWQKIIRHQSFFQNI